MTSGLLIAIVSFFSPAGIMVCLHVLLPLFAGAFFFGSTGQQRLVNLITGFVFAVVLILSVGLGFHPRPSSWADQNFGLIIVGIAPIGVVLGIAAAVIVRRVFPDTATDDQKLISQSHL
jgi:hypothetical protein